ncbi:hypothetical protein ACN2CC_29095 [Mesorhizobium muleiense]|uniref:hypothetical protein n=1 Tax=Mesorhizobium muleiense TaxID=1004279 RepID=UPI003AFB2FDE
MSGLARSPQEAMILGMVTAGLLALVAAGLLRWLRAGKLWTDLLVPASFLVAYWLAYNKVPSFPPVGAVNKVFFVAVIGTALGILAEAVGRGMLGRALALAQPIASAAYIGATRLPDALPEVAVAALWGLLVMHGLSGGTDRAEDESGTRRAALLGIACAGFAPIALLGASSSSFQLSLLFAAALAAIVATNISNPDFRIPLRIPLGRSRWHDSGRADRHADHAQNRHAGAGRAVIGLCRAVCRRSGFAPDPRHEQSRPPRRICRDLPAASRRIPGDCDRAVWLKLPGMTRSEENCWKPF